MINAFNLFLYISGIIKFPLSILLNSVVIHITLHHLNPLQSDNLTVLFLSIVDILFSLLNIIRIALHWSTKSEINSNETYCRVYFGFYWTFAGFGYISLMVLAMIRYLGICKNYMITKSMTLSMLALSSITLIILISVKIALSEIGKSEVYIFCSLNFKSNIIAKSIELALSLSACLFLVAFSFCYFNIGRVYYKEINSLEMSALELDKVHSIELNSLTGRRHHQIDENFNELEFINLGINNSNSGQTYKPKFQVIKIISLLKTLSMIIVSFIEILPIIIIHILNDFIEIRDYELIENVFYWIVEFIPLTNPLMVLFLHRETCVEFYHLIDRK